MSSEYELTIRQMRDTHAALGDAIEHGRWGAIQEICVDMVLLANKQKVAYSRARQQPNEEQST